VGVAHAIEKLNQLSDKKMKRRECVCVFAPAFREPNSQSAQLLETTKKND
jgi:hypothetical protein